MKISSLHSNFFSSLKQVEKRLKLEQTHQHQPEHGNTQSSLSTPLYILSSQQVRPFMDEEADISETPQAFLHSISSHTQQSNITPRKEKRQLYHNHHQDDEDGDDDITMLLQLLGLSLSSDESDNSSDDVCGHGEVGFNGEAYGSDCKRKDLLGSISNMGGSDICEFGDGFYENIVGVKGPKCKEEVKRLEGWIKYFMNEDGGNERIEPLRLAHLLLGKAAFESKGQDCGFEGLDFPSTVQEFLERNPPNIIT